MLYVEVGDTPVCLINLDGEYHAINDTCTHQDASLSDGEISATRSSARSMAAPSTSAPARRPASPSLSRSRNTASASSATMSRWRWQNSADSARGNCHGSDLTTQWSRNEDLGPGGGDADDRHPRVQGPDTGFPFGHAGLGNEAPRRRDKPVRHAIDNVHGCLAPHEQDVWRKGAGIYGSANFGLTARALTFGELTGEPNT